MFIYILRVYVSYYLLKAKDFKIKASIQGSSQGF